MNQIKIGHFESDAGVVRIPIGFLPDYLRLVGTGASSTNAIVYEWFREQAIGGWVFTNGTDVELAAGSGFSAYDTGTQTPTIEEWTKTRASAASARSSTARGTYIKATTSGVDSDGNRMDRSAIFECVGAATGGDTEPVWPKTVGGQVTDGTVVWERVNAPLKRSGYQGFSIDATLAGLADSDEGFFIAIQADSVEDYGDVAGWPNGIRGS